jgi:hypothetical protein
MAISRMQQPRQMYGLGSFIKKAVKGVTGAVKSFAKSPLGKAALLAGALILLLHFLDNQLALVILAI